MATERSPDMATPPTDPKQPTDAAPAASRDAGERPARGAAPATVIVRGETAPAQNASKNGAPNGGKQPDTKRASEAKLKLQKRLPALEDDADVGVQKEQVVVRDGKADLSFTGTLLASAAPEAAPHGEWEELRVYETSAGKFVFSKVTRHVAVDEEDEHEAEIFEPEPTSKPSQLLRNARDLTRAHPLTWKDEAVDFFGYEPLAKALYRKLGDDFEERVN